MKIVLVDNFNREDRPDYLVAAQITNRDLGEVMEAALQATCTEQGPSWYKLVPDNYRLSRGMVDLVGEVEGIKSVYEKWLSNTWVPTSQTKSDGSPEMMPLLTELLYKFCQKDTSKFERLNEILEIVFEAGQARPEATPKPGLSETLTAVVDHWESLKGNESHQVWAVARWLEAFAPVIQKARDVLGRARPE